MTATYLSRMAIHMRLNYYGNCVGWSPDDVSVRGGLCDMIHNATDITRRTFLKRVNREQMMELETAFGYSRYRDGGLTMAADYHVSYHKSKLHGKTVYFFKHSAIEYVFSEEA